MRLRSCLTGSLASLRTALAAYRVNPRAVAFGIGCWLVYSGLHQWSPAAAKIVLGLIFLRALFRSESSPAKPVIK